MGSNYSKKKRYGVDIVLCIDATASMEMEHILNEVKQNALNFYRDFTDIMERKDKHIGQLRVRVVAFRDYYYDRENAMLVTDFFRLPEQAEQYEACIRSITAEGGGDDPEDGLEALAYAMKSDWTKEFAYGRHVIVVWSDEGTHELGFGKSAPNYPKNMPKDFDELTSWWGSHYTPGTVMDNNSKRLVLFTPAKPGWTQILNNWNNVVMAESTGGKGLDSVTFDTILNVIANSVTH